MRKTISLVIISLTLLLCACAVPVFANQPTPEIMMLDIVQSPAPDAGDATDLPLPPQPTETVFKEEYVCIQPDGSVIRERFLPPPGYVRKIADGFGEYLRDQALMPDKSPILLYNGEEAEDQSRHAAVLSLDVGKRDVQQCADFALRLRCEYLFSIGAHEKINYHLTNGDAFPYEKYRDGYRLKVDGNKTQLIKEAEPDTSYETFRKYLNVLFNYASTRSLYPESTPVALSDIAIGDIFIFADSPGHCVMVMDICENENGEKAILLGQGNMPAQQMHILNNPASADPWFFVDAIRFPFSLHIHTYEKEGLRRIP
jgi:hypothetical protein